MKLVMSDETFVQFAIISLFIVGGMHAASPMVQSPLSNLMFGIFLMIVALNLAYYKVKGAMQSNKKDESYEELLAQAEVPKNRWGR